VAFTEEYGSDQTIQIEVVGGGIQMRAGVMNTPPAALVEAGERAVDGGQDAQLIHNGVVYTGEGRHFSIATSLAHFEFSLEPVYTNAAAQAYILPGQISFIVRNSGLVFQLNDAARSSDQLSVGIESVIPGVLGFEEVRDVISSAQSGSTLQMGGYLTSLKSGGENDLTSERLGNALAIVNYAIKQVAQLRGFLGAVQADNIEPNINALEVAIENLTASESSIRDLDFAAETSEFTRTQILFQAGTAVLASANLIPQTVLTLLQ
jgi:flagellin